MRLRPTLAAGLLAITPVSAGLAQGLPAGEGAGVARRDPGPVARIALAQRLLDFGRAESDALAVLVAARMLAGVPAGDAGPLPSAPQGAAAAPTADAGPGLGDVAALLDLAAALAAHNPGLLDLIGDAAAAASRGRTEDQGPRRVLSILPAGHTDVWELEFRGGQSIDLLVYPDGVTELEMTVADENGHVICKDRSSRVMFCFWTLRWTGAFTLDVANRGRARTLYHLLLGES